MGLTFPLLRMRNITKAFPGVLDNDHVNLKAERGEIHAILGENGAGKSTLMNILYGLYQPQEGEIFLRGRRVTITSPKVAISLGVGMVHQHFMLIPTMTVTENVILGLKGRGYLFLDLKAAEERVSALSQKYRFHLDPRSEVWQLSVGAQQRVEIIKALYRQADLLILDEPTSVLTPQETRELFSILRSLTEEGHSVIFISHKLDEALEISDRITVLRDGKVVATVKTGETDRRELARMMVGREVAFKLEKREVQPGPPVLEVRGVTARNDRGLTALKGISLNVAQGQILGLAGIDGNGQMELAEVIMGLRPVVSGRILIKGRDLTNRPPEEIIDRGVALIPADRQKMGLIMELTVAENLILEQFDKPSLSRRGILKWDVISRFTQGLIADYDVRTPSIELPVKHLSGGNQQRLIIARQFSRKPELLVAVQPTRGLDVRATEYVHRELLKQREGGSAILLISTDLDEILALSDRIAVIYNGQIVAVLKDEEADIEEIGLMMAGAAPPKEVSH